MVNVTPSLGVTTVTLSHLLQAFATEVGKIALTWAMIVTEALALIVVMKYLIGS